MYASDAISKGNARNSSWVNPPYDRFSGPTDITVTNEHDDAGNRVAVEDGESQRTEFYFDGLSRNTAIHYGVTADFSATAWVDGKRMVFDALRQTHRLMGTTPGNNALSGFTQDADSHVTAYGYDSRDRLTSVDYADDATIDRQYTLDAVGNILAVDELDGSTIGTETIADVAYVWDALNRQRAEYSAGDWHLYEYDLAGNRIDTHYSVTDAALTDPQDQADGSPIVETALLSGSSVVASRSLDSDYDPLNRLETVTEGTRVSGYRYDLAGNIREKSQPNADVIKRTFDVLGRKAVITGPGTSGSELYVYSHTFDLFGNLSRIAETYPAGQLTARTVTNTYDGADRLTIEVVTGANAATTTYGYDQANNRTLRTIDDGTPETWRYVMVAGLNRLDYAWIDANGDAAWATGEARRDYTYNNLGVMTAITGSEGDTTNQSFEYDYENRLLDVADSAASKDYTYAYDYRTRRSLRDESLAGGVSTEVSFSGGTSAREYDGGVSTPTVEYIRGSDYGGGIGGILYTLRSGTPSFKHYNSRGDVVAATDGTGSLTYQAAYEAFARHGDTPSSEEWGSTADRQQGNTKDEDGWGALNEGFRYRLLDEGVFITPDPLGYADGVNHYVFVQQNPFTFFDPKGLSRLFGAGGLQGDLKNVDMAATGSYSGSSTTWGDVGRGIANSFVENFSAPASLVSGGAKGEFDGLNAQAMVVGTLALGAATVETGLDIFTGGATKPGKQALKKGAKELGETAVENFGKNAAETTVESSAKNMSREARWKKLADQGVLSKQETKHIKKTGGKGMKDNFGKELAHPPKQSNAQGHGYENSVPKTSADHRGIQHRYLKERKTGTTISPPKNLGRTGGKLDLPPEGSLP